MAHKFNPRSMSKLDDPARIKLLPTRIILLEAGLKPGQTFLDVGAGTGYFVFPASEIVGGKGRVIAVDVSHEMLGEIEKRALAKGVNNIETRKSTEYDVGIEPGIIDTVLMSAVLHEIDDKERFLAMIGKVLKPGGSLSIVEWVKEIMSMGPPVEDRLKIKETADLLTRIGLSVVMERKYNDIFYGVTAIKR
jgi:ubiquinone/menaquinone biosynthesis C-methylase UbiE